MDGFIAIGDIHGCTKSLKALLNTLKTEYSVNRKYVFLGDYIDRGPDSKGTIDELIDFGISHDCCFIRGNHDQMLINAYKAKDFDLWLRNGGASTIDSYKTSVQDFSIPIEHLDFFVNTVMYLNTPEYVFVHAGVPAHQSIEKSLKDKAVHDYFMWTRNHIGYPVPKWEKKVIFGHTPTVNPIITDKMIGIDTGCVYNKNKGMGRLTAVVLPEMKFITQESLDQI